MNDLNRIPCGCCPGEDRSEGEHLTIWLVCFLVWQSPGVDHGVLWDYQLQRLYRGVSQQAWFDAKQALNQLARLDGPRYRHERFDLTRAWIARHEKNWDLVVNLHQALGLEEPWAVLEVADSLVRLQRYQAALDLLASHRRDLAGSLLTQARILQATAYRALGRIDEAIRTNRRLVAGRTPTRDRIAAYHQLIEMYYESGRDADARRVAETLQESQPGSDAALYTVALQEAREDGDYLARFSTWRRFARVGYDNRDFELSDKYFNKILAASRGYEAARARYFLARTLTKRNHNVRALDVFQRELPELRGSRFDGPAAFQYTRVLFMNGRDQEVVDYVRDYSQAGSRRKWQWECHQLLILALRRMGDYTGFLEEETTLRRHGAPAWLRRFYHRNGLMWNMAEDDPDEAWRHLLEYKRLGLSGADRQEALVWEGLIQWARQHSDQAVAAWLAVVGRDPNHYFGLVARQCLQQAGQNQGLWWQRWHAAGNRLDRLPPDQLRALYYLAPNEAYRQQVGVALQAYLPAMDSLRHELDLSTTAGRYAYIGRFDRAASSGDIGGSSLNRQYHRARWHKLAMNLHASVRHGDSLARHFPDWMPLELLPREVQELAYPAAFDDIVQDRAATYEVDPYLLLAIIREESHFDAEAKSWASARGLMQFIPSTAREIAGEIPELRGFSLPMLYDPQTSITLGAKYLDKLLDTFDGEALFSVAAYNAGEGAVVRWRDMTQASDPLLFVGDVTYEQTKNYCQKVLRAYHHYARVYRQAEPGVIQLPRMVGASSL